jgi:large conductance mechanosensitive channel
MREIVNGFKAFVLRGSLIELAVAFVIGAAFASLVTAFVDDMITPIISAIGGQQSFQSLTFTIHNSTFAYGAFLDALITFVVIAAAIYFVVVLPYNRYRARFVPEPEPTPMRACPFCTSMVSSAATRCPYCTSELTAVGL